MQTFMQWMDVLVLRARTWRLGLAEHSEKVASWKKGSRKRDMLTAVQDNLVFLITPA
jgi:hypothetical protein